MGHNIGDDSGPCLRCGSPTKVFSYDEAPWGFRGNYSWACPKCGRFYQSAELDDNQRVQYVFEDDAREQPSAACPCKHVKPCSENCTCAYLITSGGCTRCCSYGSPEQKKAAAERIAAAVDNFCLHGWWVSRAEDRIRDSFIQRAASERRPYVPPNVRDLTREEAEASGLLPGSVAVGVDLALAPDETRVVHGYIGPSGSLELMDEPVRGPSVIQCICCVAGGDEEKKVCEFRTDTGIEEGWYCEECYLHCRTAGLEE